MVTQDRFRQPHSMDTLDVIIFLKLSGFYNELGLFEILK